MSLWRLFREKKTPEEIKEINENRAVFYKYIRDARASIAALVGKSLMTVDTQKSISAILMDASKWLKANPRAELEDIQERASGVLNDVNNLMESDKAKITYINYMKIFDASTESLKAQGIIQDDKYNKLKQLKKDQDKWYKENLTTAGDFDYSDQIQSVYDQTGEILGSAPEVQAAKDNLQDAKKDTAKKSPEEVQQTISDNQEQIKKDDENTINLNKGFSLMLTTALSIFWRFLMLFLRVLAASFVANLAIARHPMYRILYFIYGLIPLFTPIILVYTIYIRLSSGPIPMYGILPLSTVPATTRLGKYLWYPFYYIHDEMIDALANKFKTNSISMVSTVPGPVAIQASK
jgi:hypothetical protein